METLFYLIAVLPIIWELITITQPKKVHSFIDGVRHKTENKIPIEKFSEKEKSFIILQFAYIAWIIVGLFTFNWIIFLTIILISLIPKRNLILRWLDGFITLLLLLFIVINQSHLHIDLFELIKQFLIN